MIAALRQVGLGIGLAAMLTLTIGCGGGGGGGGSSAIATAQKYVPDNAAVVATVDIARILNSNLFSQLKAEIPEIDKKIAEMKEETGMTPGDFKRVTVGGDGTKRNVSAVIEMARDWSADELIKMAKSKNEHIAFAESKAGDYTMHEAGRDGAFCFIDDRTLVAGPSAPVKAVLERNADAKMADSLSAALDHADFSQALVIVVDAKAMDPQAMSAAKMQLGAMGMGDLVESLNSLIISGDMDSKVHLEVAAIFGNDKSADDLRKMLDGMLTAAQRNPPKPELKDVLNAITVGGEGAKVSIRGSFDPMPAIKAMNEHGKVDMKNYH